MQPRFFCFFFSAMEKKKGIEASYKFFKSYASKPIRSPSRFASLHFRTARRAFSAGFFTEFLKGRF
jgi:hypothetical protein